MELLSLLMASIAALKLDPSTRPRLLLGHTQLMELILSPYEGSKRDAVRSALIHFDRLAVETMELLPNERQTLLALMECRGTPTDVLQQLQQLFGQQPVFNDLDRLCTLLSKTAEEQAVVLQLDPSFQPQFELYTGLVFQLVCNGRSAPVVLARGGRYDELVQRCGAPQNQAFGAGSVWRSIRYESSWWTTTRQRPTHGGDGGLFHKFKLGNRPGSPAAMACVRSCCCH